MASRIFASRIFTGFIASFIAFIVLSVFTGLMLGACDSWVRNQHKRSELEQCSHDCHTLYGTIEGKLVNCMERCERRFLHTGVAE